MEVYQSTKQSQTFVNTYCVGTKKKHTGLKAEPACRNYTSSTN